MKRPVVLSILKPPRISSYDIVRMTKRALGQLGERRVKIGHFGTLDPFASGLLLLGLHGASRLNDLIHEDLSKSYLAVGKLGVYTATGDLTVEPTNIDESDYLTEKIAKFDLPFLQQYLQKFVGEYWQAPHVYSAAKFQGKKLHQWAREGNEIHKPPVKRYIHSITVVKYKFPYFIFRCEVSSGTYVRSLFADIAKDLGTCGTLVSLVREKIGNVDMRDAYRMNKNIPEDLYSKGSIPITEVLPYAQIELPADRAKAFKNGLPVLTFQGKSLREGTLEGHFWIFEEGVDHPIGLAELKEQRYHVKINFPH